MIFDFPQIQETGGACGSRIMGKVRRIAWRGLGDQAD